MKIEIDKHVLINVIFMVLKPLGFFVFVFCFFLNFVFFFLCIAPIKKTKDHKCIKCDTWLISLIFFFFQSHAWFPAVSSSLKIPPYSVTLQSKSHTDITSHVIQIHKEGVCMKSVFNVHLFQQFECKSKIVIRFFFSNSFVSSMTVINIYLLTVMNKIFKMKRQS